MANPRQRRKARSSTHKAVSHSKRAKKMKKKMPVIRGPKVLQDAWDKHKTVKQNYAALGLIHTLNPSLSGGTEERRIPNDAEPVTSEVADADPSSSTRYGRIVRDADGAIVRVELPEEEDDRMSEDDDGDVMKEAQIDEDVAGKWVTDLGRAPGDGARAKAEAVIPALERISSAPSKQTTTLSIPISGIPRHSAAGEIEYLERLRAKYGDDVEKMARDRKLNTDQRTAGQLSRAMKRAGML